jgi:glycosyltransferase involved in cell wall biosynthesis
MKNKIFIQIASYRDPQLVPTIKDCLAQAAFPENLVFGIAWQHSKEDAWDSLDEFKGDSRFRIIDIPYNESQGACWARNFIQKLYQGEEYTLQLDSHHRFVKDWDIECINMIKQLQEKGHEKPLLTGYISSFDPENDPEKRNQTPWMMVFDRFIPEGAVFFLPRDIPNWKQLTEPIPARFYSAHFCFTLGKFAEEVQHDPNYYFHGEEISIAARAYTWGYDLFHPHKVIAWHEYTRKGRTKQWDDDKTWGQRNSSCHRRNRKLFEMDGEVRDINFGRYDFGPVRTLADYEKYAGINFKKRSVQQYTIDNKFPPNPILPDEEYENSWLRIFKHCIDIQYSDVPEDDYTTWVVTFEDEENKELYRKDVSAEEIKNFMKMKDKEEYIKIWREFHTEKQPKKWIFWPHSKSKGWHKRIERTI